MTHLPPTAHLSEDEHQRTADGTLDDADRARVSAHLAACPDCAADVARLTALMQHVDESRGASATFAAELNDLWPDIRRQIDGNKVVSLEPEATGVSSRRWRVDPWVIGVAASVAAVTALTVIRVVPPIVRTVAQTTVRSASGDSMFRLADDSIKSYQIEADELLDELKLERARLAPETQASIDDDLKTVDLAIAELQAAIARDPNNPTLRAMLASSYRQKVDVLKKASNAG